MLIKKQNPVGIDKCIESLNRDMHDYLIKAWGIKNHQDMYKAYGRVYRNAKESGYVPEFYDGNGEYSETLLDDKINALSFFGIDNMTTANNATQRKVNVHFVVIVNLEELMSNVKHRADVEIQKAVDDVLQIGSYGFIIKSGPITGIERVFEEYPGMNRDSIKYKADMYPWHCFRYNLELTYSA